MKLNNQFLRSVHFDRPNDLNESTYPYNIPALKKLNDLEFHPKVTFLVGENGSGKSTLLEALAISLGINAEGGSRNLNFQTRNSHSGLYANLKAVRGTRRPSDTYFLRAESFYNVATAMENLEDIPGKPPIDPILHEFSHGEAFFKIIFDRLGKNGLYLFDEPEAALSPSRQLSFISRMHELCELNSQLVIATHSPLLLSYPHATIYQFSSTGIHKINYEDTDHYQVTKLFLNDYQKMLAVLLDRKE